ncbi:TPA: hypothetical protein ACKJ4G_001449 [Neisseria gonorrhoeae]
MLMPPEAQVFITAGRRVQIIKQAPEKAASQNPALKLPRVSAAFRSLPGKPSAAAGMSGISARLFRAVEI